MDDLYFMDEALKLAKEAYRRGGSCGAALNGANETAVDLFLKGRINLPTLFEAVEKATFEACSDECSPEAVFDADGHTKTAYSNSISY